MFMSSRSLKRHDWLSGVLIEFKTFNNTVMSEKGNTPYCRWDEFCVWWNENWENTQKDTHSCKKKKMLLSRSAPPHIALIISLPVIAVLQWWLGGVQRGRSPDTAWALETCFILANGPGSNENPGSAPVLGTFCDASIEGRSTCH